MSLAPATLPWFAAHEVRLAWRDMIAMMTGGHRTRAVVLVILLGVLGVVFHLVAAGLVRPWVEAGVAVDRQTLVVVTAGGLLFWTVMLSQALESVTRAYYSRADLDLILSSPAPSRRLFAVRAGATALVTLALSLLIASPLINALALLDGPRWLFAYPVLAALSALSTALAIALTLLMFKTFGPKRTRIVAQIVAAVVGAGFVIGVQAAAILSFNSLSRFDFIASGALTAAAPDERSPIWLPARAAMGDVGAFAVLAVVGFGALAASLVWASSSFARLAIAAGGVAQERGRTARAAPFRAATQKQALRRKEWKLLARDPWLLSQTLMQLLYLLPPALLLWMNFGASAGIVVIVVPVVVMASGQLAGGLAWLAISGEDAHELVSTAPLYPRLVLRAKVEAVAAVLAVVLAPILVLMALASPLAAAATALCAVLATASSTAIQLWFRMPMRRAMFRRRQVASRIATLSEAFVSITWAGAGALLATGGSIALGAVLPALVAIGVLALAYALSPKGKRR